MSAAILSSQATPNFRVGLCRTRADCRFQFHKRSQLFIRTHNETLSVAMRVNDPDCFARHNPQSPKDSRT